MDVPTYDFITRIASVVNSGESRSLLLCGNVLDIFGSDKGYVQLIPFLTNKYRAIKGRILVVWELNGPIRFVNSLAEKLVCEAWRKWTEGRSKDQQHLSTLLAAAASNQTAALELLRQLCLLSRSTEAHGAPYLQDKLTIVIEGVDLLLPAGESVVQLPPDVLRRIIVLRDWLGDPDFQAGEDVVLLVAESRSAVNSQVTRLPHLLDVQIPLPARAERLHFLRWFQQQRRAAGLQPATHDGSEEEFASLTEGFLLQTLAQLLQRSGTLGLRITAMETIAAIEKQAVAQLGEGRLIFKRPTHDLHRDVKGNSRIKAFLRDVLIPRLKAGGKNAPSAVVVAGPMGAGKTYIFEAVAASLGIPVVILGSFRDMWFGQSEVIWERLVRFLQAFHQVLLLVDEADTAFGGIGPQSHEVERRLTGKFSTLVSDPANRGRIISFLMTARVHLLPPDLIRFGRGGDFIVPILDPADEDLDEFIAWVLEAAEGTTFTENALAAIRGLIEDPYAATLEFYRREIKATREQRGQPLTADEVEAIIADISPPPTGRQREYQALQALLHCTRLSLLSDEQREQRKVAEERLRELEALGIRGY